MLSGLFALIASAGAFTPVDPPDLAYSTYLPGPSAIHSAVDKAGSQYFAFNSTAACDAPPAYVAARPVVAAFIGKLENEGQSVTWIACVPGSSGGLAIHDSGAIYVATTSGGSSAVTRLSPDTFKPVYATTLGGVSVTALTLDRAGNAYAAGSATAGLTTTPGAYLGNCSTTTCGFVSKIAASGAVNFFTYTPSRVNAIAVDSRGQAWITGTVSFEVTSMGTRLSVSSAFIGRLDADGKAMLFSRSFGGGLVFRTPAYGGGLGIAIDGDDSAYAVGIGSTGVPTTPGAIQESNPPASRASYLVKFSSAGNVTYGTYLDGLAAHGVAVDAAGNAYVGTTGQDRPASQKGNCGWLSSSRVMAINRDGSKVLASGLVGGWIYSLAWSEPGIVYVSGITLSSAFVTTAKAYQPEFPRLSQSAFAAKIDFSSTAQPILTCVANAASRWAGRTASGFNGAVAPGELVTIYGEPFPSGQEVSVTFDGVAAPILYSGANQINAVVPFTTGRSGDFTQLSIRLGAQEIGPYRLPVSRAVPGVFATEIDGLTQAAALNQDGSLNSSGNPAPPGSVVTVFMTGAGLFDREMEDGSVGPSEPPFPIPVLGVGAGMWSTSWPIINAPVLFAGQAPGMIAGVVQVNLRIPDGLTPGPAYLVLYFGNFPTPYQLISVGAR